MIELLTVLIIAIGSRAMGDLTGLEFFFGWAGAVLAICYIQNN